MERKRLTITLRKDLLPQVDEIIDGAKIRNRSHAIEYLLLQSLRPRLSRAFILAGGEGIKMRPFTYEMPKSMLPVHNRPILEYIIDLLRNNEIREIIILVGHLGEKIKNHFGDGTKFGVKISYLEEKKAEGTAKPLLKIKKFVRNQPFLVIYGDILAEINLQEFFDFHQGHGNLASVALSSVAEPSSYGVVKLRGDKILGFEEKPKKNQKLSRLVSAGIYILNPKVINYVPNKAYSMLEEDVLPQLARESQLFGWPFEGQWFDVGTPEIYERVLKEWKK
ncbi:MAG: sugar phosphate nucleotidyltransferase [Patescibacteria group bacterium]